MTTPSDQQLSQALRLFDTVSELPSQAHAAWLDTNCADPTVRALLEQMLAGLNTTQDPIGESVGSVAPDLLRELEEPEAPPAQLGAYSVIDELGRGGMGVVYRAARSDGAYDQQVALKLLPGALAVGQGVRRFEQERQILARLNHPGIATLLDGGTTAEGQPYLVMELINGEPITEYADQQRLGDRTRVELLLQVAETIAHAESQLIVHGDIKPNNVLVTPTGQSKLLDFGIARLLDVSGEAAGGVATQEYRPLTPAYSTPEQLLGEPLTTATDVYQLGLLLYRLLAGADLQRLNGLNATEMQAHISTTTIELPAVNSANLTNSTGAMLQPHEHRDVVAILNQALAQEPSRRYRDAAAFAADLQRLLAGLPVAAVAPSRGYRLRKYLRRHRAGAATAALVVAVTLTFITLLASQERRVRGERDIANVEAAKANALANYLINLIASANPTPIGKRKGEEVTVMQVVDASVQRLQTELQDQPAVRGRLMSLNGEIYERALQDAQAEPVLKQALAILAEAPPAATADSRLGAWFSLARIAFRQGETDAGFDAFDKALAAYADGGSDPANKAQVLMRKGQYAFRYNRHAEAAPLINEAVAIFRELMDSPIDDPHQTRQSQLVGGLIALSDIWSYAQQPGRAIEVLTEALALAKSISGDHHPTVLNIQLALAREMYLRGDTQEALAMQSQTLDALIEHQPPTTPRAMLDQGVHHWFKARLLRSVGAYDQVEPLLQRAQELFQQSPESARFLPRVYQDRCLLKAAQKQTEDALSICKEALELQLQHFGPEHLLTSEYQIALADQLSGQPEATELYAKALESRSAQLPGTDWRVAEAKLLVLTTQADRVAQNSDEITTLLSRLESHEMQPAKLRATAVLEALK